MANADLASLAREREARRGGPPPRAPTSPSINLQFSSLFSWRLFAVVLAGWAAFAFLQRSSCGCGPQHTPEKALESALSGLGKVLSGEGSFSSSLENFGQSMQGLQEGCSSRWSSSVCYTACRLAGMEIQRKFWWECFKSGGSSASSSPRGSARQMSAWPDLDGVDAKVAEERIRKDRPDVSVSVVDADAIVTADYDEARVRIFTSEGGRVVRIPRVG